MKWCWARLPGGVVTWDTYEMFKVGESSREDHPPMPHDADTGTQNRVTLETPSALSYPSASNPTRVWR